jgi:transposase
MRESYPSDITRKQFEEIRDDLEAARKRTSPRTVDLYDVFCGILYCLKSGAQWRMLPKTYPKWQLCYYYFKVWSEKKDPKSGSILELVLKKMCRKNAYSRWSEGENIFHYYRCPKCKKLRHGRKKGI